MKKKRNRGKKVSCQMWRRRGQPSLSKIKSCYQPFIGVKVRLETKEGGNWKLPFTPQSGEITASQRDAATEEERPALSLAILMTSGAYRCHLKALRITEERKTRATCADTSLFELKRTRCAESRIVFPPYQKPTHLILLMTTRDT